MGALSRANYVLWSWINFVLRMPPLAAWGWWQEHPTKNGWEKGTGFLKWSFESLPTASCLSGFLCSSFHLLILHYHPGLQAYCPFILSSLCLSSGLSFFLGDRLKYSLIDHLDSFTVLSAITRGQKATLNAEIAWSPSFHHKLPVLQPQLELPFNPFIG